LKHSFRVDIDRAIFMPLAAVEETVCELNEVHLRHRDGASDRP
jgi:hypothetical protein